MNEEQIADIWSLFKEYLDKKQIELAAEKYVDLLADYGVDDITLKDCLGVESSLDAAIQYYLADEDDEDDDLNEWEDQMGWYSAVSRDINQIPAAIQYFETELVDAKLEVKLKGNVERAASEMPGIVEHRFNQLQELEAILNYLNIELRRLRSSFFKKYLENYQRALSSRDVEKYVDGEADVVDYEKIINEFALMRNKWLGVLKALDQKQWQITNVVKLRVAGMEDASL